MQDALPLRNLSPDTGGAPDEPRSLSRQRLSVVQPTVDAETKERTHRVLVTILFIDIVASTEKLALIGDRAFARLLADFRSAVRSALVPFRGHEFVTAGDGFLATFDSPSRALRCTARIHATTHQLDIAVRAGLHTGEVERERRDINGIAVHISARIAALAGANETLVSGTVRDLVAGSGLSFVERGKHLLKGVPGRWPLYATSICA